MIANRSTVLVALALALCGCRTHAELPVFGAVPPFALTDQAGRPFTRETLHGKVWAAAFVFTRCPSACPRVTRAMRDLQARSAARHVPLHLVSFSVDPEFDTPEVLRAYAAQYGADISTWTFVTGDAAAIQRTAEQGLKIGVEGTADPTKPDFGIAHGTQLVLVDGKGEIRGYYATNDEAALGRLLEDAQSLR